MKAIGKAALGLFGWGIVTMAKSNKDNRHRENEQEFRTHDRADANAFLAQAMRSTREELAALAHQERAGWIDAALSASAFQKDGSVVLPAALISDWQRLRATPYAELSEGDRIAARSFAAAVIAIWCDVPFVWEG